MLQFRFPRFWFLVPLLSAGYLLNAAMPAYSDRSEIPERFKWDLSLYYPGWKEWQADVEAVDAVYRELAGFEGRLGEGPDVLLEALKVADRGGLLLTKVFGYVAQMRDLDTRDNEVQSRFRELIALYSRIMTRTSWLDPEILQIPRETMEAWISGTPGLGTYRFNLMDTYRTGHYTLDHEGERLLDLHGKVRQLPRDIYSSLTNADGDRPEVLLADGSSFTVTPGTYRAALNRKASSADRFTIQKAWMEQFRERRNTFAAIYNGVLQQGWTLAESRGYPSTIEMKLNGNNIPLEVVTNLVEAARQGAGELQRYHRLRHQFMGLQRYGWSDMHLPLITDETVYDYEEIIPLVVQSVKPLGEEYHRKMAEQFRAGYVDVFETPGKRSGAYNTSRYGVGSFVLLNYHGSLDDVFTVAHEMGHSMHSRLSQEYQPFVTHRYTIFVAEVASILNEKLLLRKLLEKVSDPGQRIAFLESQISKITGTFFLQTMMADFEMQAHALAEAGEGITADRLTALWRSVVSSYFGDVIPEDDPYMHSWARIPHLYNSPFYVYQYATCYASAASLLQQMEADPAAVDRYLELLKSGGNDYPMNQLRKAGVDLSQPDVLQAVIREFSRLVNLLETEYARYLDARRVTS